MIRSPEHVWKWRGKWPSAWRRPGFAAGGIATLLVLGMAALPVEAGWGAERGDGNPEAYAERLSAARVAYFRVIVTNDRASDRQAREALAELEREYPGDPVAKAYHGSLELLEAAHSWDVWNLPKQSAEGLRLMDEAVAQAPDEPEVRFLRAATAWHLPGFYHRQAQCESDFGLLAGRAERDAREGRLPPELAAAALNYWGQILANRKDDSGARAAFAGAVRVAPLSPGGQDAERRLRPTL